MANKLLADSNRASLREIIESNSAWGTTPASGVTRNRRFTSSSLAATKETTVSDEIRADRMVSSVIETAAMSGGEINWEFAAGTADLDLQRVLMGAWSRPMTFDFFRGVQVSITGNNTIAIAGADRSAYFTAGRRLKLSGFVNPANNDYVEISSVAFSAGVTTVTITATTLVAEAASQYTTVADANDVIILKNTNIGLGATANTIDSGANNVFASAIAAGQLVVGQRIFVEGVGYETGTITAATVLAGESVTINDGVNEAVTLVADTDFEIGADDTETATNLAAAINALRPAGTLNCSATSALGVVTVRNLNKTGGTLTEDDATLAVTAFTGGNATAGGFYTISALTDDTIVVDRALPVIAASAPVTIKGSMLRNPSDVSDITPQSASIETSFFDVDQHFIADGLRMGALSMEITAGAIVTGSTTTMGRETKRLNANKLGNASNYTVLEAPATEVVSATANVGSLTYNGNQAATAIRSIQFSLEGNLRNQQAVGSKFPVGIAAGRLNLSGTVEAYFADGQQYDQFLQHETVALTWPIIDLDGNTYYFTIPAFKIASDPIAPGGIDQDVMENMEFTAFRDPVTECMMQIDRFSSTNPITAL
ncbi:putative major tail tube protein [Erythrobacter phage vB_EliS-L02]|nr:putative major tail tube protein [Erythrobacter phage vB_EliS-L02]